MRLRLKELREEQHLTQTQLAVRANKSPVTINQIETGIRNPSLKTLEELADALGVEVTDLFERVDPLKAEPPLPFAETQAEQRNLHLLLAAWQEYLVLPFTGRAEALKEALRFSGLRELDEQEAATRIRIAFAQADQFVSDMERLSVIDRAYFAPLSSDPEKLGPEEAKELASIRQTIADLRTKSDQLAERVEKIRQRTRDQGFAREQVDTVFAELEAVNQD
jgi:transcriptional regulator with XRE-family HTH domain